MVHWDAKTLGPWVDELEGAAAIVHLNGRPSPTVVAKLGAPLLGSSASLALTGRRCLPTRLLEAGFTFDQPRFESTARHALEQVGAL